MNKLKQIKHILVLLIGVLVFSCDNGDVSQQDSIDYKSENLVTIESAKRIAESMLLSSQTGLKSTSSSTKKVESILEVPDINNVAAYYIINYEGGGFVILAGDKRSEPILAFSEVNRFDLDAEKFPSGLVDWLSSSKQNIEAIRINNAEIQPGVESSWSNLESTKSIVSPNGEVPPDEPDCTPYTIQFGPFLQTTWGQGCYYNSQTPLISCGPCGHAWTGCVATAMAQVMKYYQYPTRYAWSDMPNSVPTASTARLMADIGSAVSMKYTCDGSSADTKDKVASAFKNTFGYRHASYADYNYDTVMRELRSGNPVILKGGRNTGWWIFGQYSDGHAWVCDGYLQHVDPCYATSLKLSMNWGWDGTYNGWYSFNNFNPGDNTFNYKTGMVYDIWP